MTLLGQLFGGHLLFEKLVKHIELFGWVLLYWPTVRKGRYRQRRAWPWFWLCCHCIVGNHHTCTSEQYPQPFCKQLFTNGALVLELIPGGSLEVLDDQNNLSSAQTGLIVMKEVRGLTWKIGFSSFGNAFIDFKFKMNQSGADFIWLYAFGIMNFLASCFLARPCVAWVTDSTWAAPRQRQRA